MRNYLAHFNFIGKLLFLIVPPLIIIFYFTTEKMVREYSDYKALEEVENSVILSVQISALVHELQIERGMSAGYIASGGSEFGRQLQKQHKQVDIQYAALKALLKRFNNLTYSNKIHAADSMLNDLDYTREKVMALSIPVETEIDFYTQIISLYLEDIPLIAKHSESAWLTRELLSFGSFLYAKEKMGIERALGADALARKKIPSETRLKMTALIAEQNTYLKSFLNNAGEDTKSYYDANIDNHSFNELKHLEEFLLYGKSPQTLNVNPEYWFFLYTQKIDLYKQIHEFITTKLVNEIEMSRSEMYRNMIYTFILNIIFLLGGIIILFTVSKRLYSEIKDQQQVLIQQSKMAAMGEMIGAISHQWRQPLNGIGVLLQEIEMKYALNLLTKEEMETLSKEVLNYLEYMSNTIDDFRDFFKPTKQKTVFDPLRSIQDSLAITGKQLTDHAIKVDLAGVCEESECHFAIEGYESEFKQVIINLINNAREAIEERAKHTPSIPKLITIRVERNEDDILIRIRDTGGGIPEKMLGSIFELYVSTKHEQQGTGLGLYMSKLIIERNMLGHLSARNVKDGAEFEIALLSAVSDD